MLVNSLTPDQEAAAEALFVGLPRQAPVFMLRLCRFLDDPTNLKAWQVEVMLRQASRVCSALSSRGRQ